MSWKKIWPYWGLIALVLAIAGWLTSDIGPAGLTALFALSCLWFLFQAPNSCGAQTRRSGEKCRNNAHGALRGCHLEQHKWQRARSLFIRPTLRRAGGELFSSPTTGLASLGALVTLVCTLTTTALAAVGKGGS
ncbi:hypothetical protein ACOKM3_30385 [Streptomyces sp. BH106]|uniref:hypothetical protein n=1 Tax=Streptomyces sp. BH106 TaxID=3410409 RepID=UPI003CFA5875